MLDPRLKSLLATRAHHEKRAGALAADAPPEPDRVGVLVKFTGNVDELIAAGLDVESVIGHERASFSIATGTIGLDLVEGLAAVSHVTKVEMGRPLQDELDVSTVEIRAKPLHTGASPLTGKRVVVGVIDSGLDYTHHAFRFASGGSRVLFIWDQSHAVRARRPGDPFQEAAPPEFPTLGIEYNQSQITQALGSSNPLDVVRVEDTKNAHGTHVTGIAAGDGSQAGTRVGDHCTGANTYVGVAPEADIIFVKNRFESDALGESTNLVNAIRYIFARAGQLDGGSGRPCVINISQGDNLGPHDGTSLVEQAIDLMVLFDPGRAVVKSAGNEGAADHHAMATVPSPGNHTITFDMPPGAVSKSGSFSHHMECWYDGAQRLDVTMTAPGAPAWADPPVHPNDAPYVWTVNPTAPIGQRATVTITSTLNDPDNNDNRIDLEFSAPQDVAMPNGQWGIQFTNTGAAPADIHCWLDRGVRKEKPVFTSDVTTSHTISIPGTSDSVITVGSYAAEELDSSSGEDTEQGDLDDSSSRGPTRLGVRKPDIAAPGVSVTSARARSHAGCCCDCCYDFYVDKSGTSMAAPHVTGVIALMLQKNRTLDFLDIRNALITTARAPDEITPVPDNEWGAGKVDATAAVGATPAPAGGVGGGGGGGGGGPIPFWVMDVHERTLFRRLQHFQRWVLGFPAGHQYAALVSRHFDEVLRLINTNRKVAAVWHRNGGPALVRAALAIAESPARAAIPAEVNGEALAPQLERILESWRRYASPAFTADIDRYRPDVLALAGRSLQAILGSRESAA
jgi:subtilisin family serine protease